MHRQLGDLSETPGFASPPHDGFALFDLSVIGSGGAYAIRRDYGYASARAWGAPLLVTQSGRHPRIGMLPSTRVPICGDDVIVRLPPTASMRWCMVADPFPGRAASKPRPLSWTLNSKRLP
jgi:hypothetical protein